jgi:hypothetical protein
MDVIKATGLESIEAEDIFCNNISILSSLIITGSSTLNNTTILSTLNVVGDIVSSGVSSFSLNVSSINILNNLNSFSNASSILINNLNSTSTTIL